MFQFQTSWVGNAQQIAVEKQLCQKNFQSELYRQRQPLLQQLYFPYQQQVYQPEERHYDVMDSKLMAKQIYEQWQK